MQKFCKCLVPFEIPNGDGFGEHAVVGELECIVGPDPFALITTLAMVARDEYEKFETLRIFVRNALYLFDAQAARALRCIL